jgi:hypothetical protein
MRYVPQVKVSCFYEGIVSQVCKLTYYTEGSKSNIHCCAQHLLRIRGCDARFRREPRRILYVTQILRAKFAYDVRHVARVQHAKDVTFGPLCSLRLQVSAEECNYGIFPLSMYKKRLVKVLKFTFNPFRVREYCLVHSNFHPLKFWSFKTDPTPDASPILYISSP